MKNTSPWTRFRQGISRDLQRVWYRLGPARARVQELWRPLSVLYKLFFVVVGTAFLIIIAWQAFPWDVLSIAALGQAPWRIGAIGLGIAFILPWGLPKWQATRLGLGPKEQFEVENEARKTLAAIVGGAAVLASLLFTWENLRVTQDNLRITQDAATRSQELTREGQITERFTRAIDQLGAVNDNGAKSSKSV